MSLNTSRRDCLKIFAAGSTLLLPNLRVAAAGNRAQAVVVTGNTPAVPAFIKELSEQFQIVRHSASCTELEGFRLLADLPENHLLIGLISDAEMVLMDALVYDRRGLRRVTGRIEEKIVSELEVIEAAKRTAKAAINHDRNARVGPALASGSGSLLSFYAYL
jgi:hypothetical protein